MRSRIDKRYASISSVCFPVTPIPITRFQAPENVLDACKKVGDDWICTGKKCNDKVKRDLEKRQCSCRELPNGEWLCGGPKCPRDFPTEETDLE
ncbi:hypothetical protein ACHAPJ_010227 [Fusarium lateritium]